MIDIGFTGTQQGMTDLQRQAVCHRLEDLLTFSNNQARLHHGDCVGADAQAHSIAYRLGYELHLHPSVIPKKRAFCKSPGQTESAPSHPLERNKHIVDACSILIAASGTMEEILRSGTWSTIRYARKIKRQIIIIYPDGRVVIEN